MAAESRQGLFSRIMGAVVGSVIGVFATVELTKIKPEASPAAKAPAASQENVHEK